MQRYHLFNNKERWVAQVTLFTKMAHEAYVIRWLLTKPFGALLKGIPTGETILRFPIWQNWNPHWEDHPVGVVFSRSLITPTTNWQSLVFSLYLFLCSLSLYLLCLGTRQSTKSKALIFDVDLVFHLWWFIICQRPGVPLKPDLMSLNKIQVAQIYCELGVSSMMVHYLKKVCCTFLVRLGN